MKTLKHISIIILFLHFQACHHDDTCQQLFSKIDKPNRTEEISVEKIYDGHNMRIESRFEFSCVVLDSTDISSDVNFDRKSDDFVSIKLLSPEKYKLKNNDIIKVFFTDKRKLVWDMFAVSVKLVILKIKKEATPCDSVFNIIYKDISGKIEDIVTNERVEATQLYDYTLKNKIKQYISSLSISDSIKFNKCQKEFFILDLINNSGEFGFIENEYYLTPRLKEYLNTMAESIASETKQRNWNKSQFIIKCIGYADERSYTGSSLINYSNLGTSDSTDVHISYTNCQDDNFEELGKLSIGFTELKTISNNCDLSILRGYVAATYLENRLKLLTNLKFIFKYRGGGEVPNETYDINRKIDLYLEIKGVAEK